MTPAKKIAKTKSVACLKDGHGMHWHVVGWISAVAIVLSTSTMTLSASAQTSQAITPTVLYRSLGDIHTKLNRIEAKIDRLGTQCTSSAQCAPAPATQAQEPAPSNEQRNQATTPPPPTEQGKTQVLPTFAVAQCRQKCEDDFNACTKTAGADQKKYSVCKQNYEQCWTNCANAQ